METIVILVRGELAVTDELNNLIGNHLTDYGWQDYIAEAVLSLAVLQTGYVLAVVRVRAEALRQE